MDTAFLAGGVAGCAPKLPADFKHEKPLFEYAVKLYDEGRYGEAAKFFEDFNRLKKEISQNRKRIVNLPKKKMCRNNPLSVTPAACVLSAIARRATAEAIPWRPEGAVTVFSAPPGIAASLSSPSMLLAMTAK